VIRKSIDEKHEKEDFELTGRIFNQMVRYDGTVGFLKGKKGRGLFAMGKTHDLK